MTDRDEPSERVKPWDAEGLERMASHLENSIASRAEECLAAKVLYAHAAALRLLDTAEPPNRSRDVYVELDRAYVAGFRVCLDVIRKVMRGEEGE